MPRTLDYTNKKNPRQRLHNLSLLLNAAAILLIGAGVPLMTHTPQGSKVSLFGGIAYDASFIFALPGLPLSVVSLGRHPDGILEIFTLILAIGYWTILMLFVASLS